jgi:amino acid permease
MTKQLTFMEAASIVAGYGIGGGMMAVPYLASLAGWASLLVVSVLSYFISLLLHLMIVEMMMRDDKRDQVVELLNEYLFRGRFGLFFTWAFFGLCVLAFFGTLTVYLVGSGEIFRDTLHLPLWVGEVIFYILAAGVAFFGLKAVGLSEKFGVAAIALVVIVLVAVTLIKLPFSFEGVKAVGEFKPILALYGMVMFSLFAFFSVPQAVVGLRWNPRLVPWAVAAGLGITFVLVLVISLVVMGSNKEVTQIAIVGWGKALGGWSMVLGQAFILLAMLTSFWSISLALAVVLQERLGWGEKLSWAVATLPSLVVALIGFTDFLGFLRLTGGLIAVLVAVIMVPAYLSTKKHGPTTSPAWTMGKWASHVFLAIVIVGYVLVIIGSSVKLE